MNKRKQLEAQRDDLQRKIQGFFASGYPAHEELEQLSAINTKLKEFYGFEEKNKRLQSTYGAPVEPKKFLRGVFGRGNLQANKEDKNSGKPNAIAFYRTTKTNKHAPGILYDDLDDDKIKYLSKQKDCFLLPCGFYGRRWTAERADCIFAMVFDLDEVEENHLSNLLFQLQNKVIPQPTYIVNSGHGLHLWYVLEQPIKMNLQNKNTITKYVDGLKYDLGKYRIFTSYLCGSPEQGFQSYVHAYRMPGSATKMGAPYIVTAFKSGKKVTLAYLADFTTGNFKETLEESPSKYTLEECKTLFPQWYERITTGKICTYPRNPAIYESYLKRLETEATYKHRYYCIYTLAATAAQCDIEYEKLKEDAYSLLPRFVELSDEDIFTPEDIEDALRNYYAPDALKMSNARKTKNTAIEFKQARRNGRKREEHLKIARAMQGVIDPGAEWRNKDGRPKGSGTKEHIIKEWREENPDGTKADCIRSTGISKPTVYKYWNTEKV